MLSATRQEPIVREGWGILGHLGADNGGEGKSKRAGKYGTKKRKERREEPLGTLSYQTSSKRSPRVWFLIGQKNTKVFWHQSEARTAATVWNWSGKTLGPFIRGKIRRVLNKTRTFRINGTFRLK